MIAGFHGTDAEAAAERAAIQAEGASAEERAVAFSWGCDSFDNYPKQRTAESFAEFAKYVCGHRAKEKGKLYFSAPFAEQDGKHHRSKDTAAPRRFLPLDLDYIPNGEALLDLLLALQPFRHFAYTTASHTPELPRLRVVLELSRLVDRDEGLRIGLAFQAQLLERTGVAELKFDQTVYRAEQPCFGPLTHSEIYPRDRRMSGAVLDVDELLAAAPEIEPTVTAASRAERIAHDDPRIAYLYEHGYVLDAPTPVGKLPIRCPNAAAHSHETGPTATVVLLPHFNGVVHAKIHCLHDSCANVTQDEFWRLSGYVEPSKRGNGAAHEDPRPGDSGADANPPPPDEPQNLFASQAPNALALRVALPSVLADFAAVRAGVAGHDPTAYAYAAIGAASGVVPHRTRIEITPTWREPLLQWVAEVGPTGSGKSPAMNAAVEPVVALHCIVQETYTRNLAAWKSAKGEGEAPARSGYYFTDPSIEALIDRAANASHTILRHADEGTAWLNAMGRYSTRGDSGERGIWLAGWNGAPYTVTRIERGDKSLDAWAVALLYGITPGKLKEAYADAASDGMLARTLICLTDGGRWIPAQPDPNVKAVTERYAKAIQAAARAECILTLSPQATERWRALRDDYRATAQAVAEIAPGLSGFLVKAPTMAARLAGLFALLEGSATVSDGSMERAQHFIRHAAATARIAHEQVFAVSQPVAIARRLAARILTSSGFRITRREFMRTDAFAKATEPERGAAIEHLAASGWLLEADGKRIRLGPRFREATGWRVNPLVHECFADIAETERQAAQDALARMDRLFGDAA